MKQTNVATVSYQNAIPFRYGLQYSKQNLNIRLLLSPPSECAESLKNRDVDIALIPAIKLLELTDVVPFSDYCIGASNQVYSVALFSNCPLKQIEIVYLDTESRTSVELVKILAREYWNIAPQWLPLVDIDSLKEGEACLLIGDKVFEHESKFANKFDLAQQWNSYTGMHFVFALWVAHKSVDEACKQQLNEALKLGVDNIDLAIKVFGKSSLGDKLEKYLKSNIEFCFTQQKKEGLALFLNKVKEPSSD